MGAQVSWGGWMNLEILLEMPYLGHRLHRGSTKSKVRWKWELGKGPRRAERSLLEAVRKWFCFSLVGALKVACSTYKWGITTI